jgi:hypothetical protein
MFSLTLPNATLGFTMENGGECCRESRSSQISIFSPPIHRMNENLHAENNDKGKGKVNLSL